MDQERDFSLTHIRKSIEKLGSSAEGYGDPTLMRFLIARSMEVDKAAKMFVQWRKWRDAMVPNGFISESEVPDELEAKKIFLQDLSQDKYPVMIVQASKHFPSKDQIQFKKFVVYLLDKTIASAFKGREIGNEMLIGILDLQNISYKNVDARGLITGFQFLQAYYPERLAKCYILHMPWFFVSVWKLVSRFLEKATLQKVVEVLKIGNNDTSKVISIGTVYLETSIGTKLILKNVRHAPSFRLHLISTSVIDDDSYISTFGGGQWKKLKFIRTNNVGKFCGPFDEYYKTRYMTLEDASKTPQPNCLTVPNE